MRWNVLTRWAVLAAVVVTGCSRSPEPAQPAPVFERVEAEQGFTRYAVEPVPVPRRFREAIERGTRTERGVPGPRYWQQRVDYTIAAELDPRSGRLQGEETVVYHNNSPDTLGIIVFHLYQNLFREGAQRMRTVPITGGMTIERVAVSGREATTGRSPAPGGAAYQVDPTQPTLMYVRPPRPIAPGDSVEIEIAWRFTVPPQGAPRMGHIDNEVYNIAQWYPQVAVYDDVDGWHTWPYLGNAEFYLEYGNFDVSITVPEGWLVAATGELQNPDEVLAPQTRRRLARALETDEVVRVVTRDDFGTATQRAPGGQLTWRFTARDVRDFAWATSNQYLWDATRAIVPGRRGGRDTVAIHAFYRPVARSWPNAAEYTRFSIEFFAERWHPYIYPQMTSAEGPVGGMEYPMITFVREFGNARTVMSVIAHEVAHEWWPMMVGNKEPSFAWQDEGLGTYIENQAVAAYFNETDVYGAELQNYLAIAGTDDELPLMRHADLYGIYPVFVVAAYSKPAVLLHALAGIIGEETLNRALRTYAERWLLKHPYPLDFFNTVEDVAGRDLDWFWHPWWYETAYLDQAIMDVAIEAAGGGERATITIEDQGTAPMPVHIVVTNDAGETRRVEVPVDVWLAGARYHAVAIEVPGRIARIEIDPEQRFPDVDRNDNVWSRSGGN